MICLGLTGGIACGKSNISDGLRALGAVIVDGDALSRELTAPGGPALPSLRTAFGGEIFRADGTLDRGALGGRVFGDPAALATLDGIMQPLLLTLIRRRIAEAEQSGAAVCVLDMPLLYEKGLDSLCDRVWCAYLPEDLQLERLMARNGYTREEALKRVRSQLPAKEKADRADTVIETTGTLEETRALLPPLYRRLLAEGAKHE